MNKTRTISKKGQSGAIGVFVAIALVIVFGLIGLQNVMKTSTDLYLSNSKQQIEEARQLAFAGLRHYTHVFGNDEAIQQLINNNRRNLRMIVRCSDTKALPDTLTPTEILATPNPPNPDLQSIVVKGIVVPFNCDTPISNDNYRATFEIVASVNCNGVGIDSGCVNRSFVFNREDNDNGKLEYKTISTPRPPVTIRPPRPPGPPREHGKGDGPPPRPPRPPAETTPGGNDESTEVIPIPPSSQGKQEVGF